MGLLQKLFNRKPKEEDEFKLTFSMPRAVFKEMLPTIEKTQNFPIIFDWKEVRNIVNSFMVKQKDEIVVKHGDTGVN